MASCCHGSGTIRC